MSTRTMSRERSPAAEQGELFAPTDPAGFRYKAELISPDEEADIVAQLETLSFEPFDFHGHLANRRVVGFGLRYDYGSRDVIEAPPLPDWLIGLRDKAGAFAGLSGEALVQVLINEYRPDA